tara:strand:- start:483 stop:1478 length:996 start_codon:yes stop_codon:yes gene_type:complete
MQGIIDIAAANLLAPMVLFFALGFIASLVRSDLAIPEAIAKGISLYLVMAIGFKGGAEVAASGVSLSLILALVAGGLLSAIIPFIAFVILRFATGLSRIDAGAVAAHYGSISIVTFIAATQALNQFGMTYDGHMVAVAAVMEAPAILAGLLLATGLSRSGDTDNGGSGGLDRELLREIAVNGSILLLAGSFLIGCITGHDGLATIAPFIVDPFKGVLCIFLLDMGLIAGRGFARSGSKLNWRTVAFGLYMPLIGAAVGYLAASLTGMEPGSAALLMTLSASASYIAVPAAMRLALPEADPAISLTLSLAITFPFNLTLGIPLYVAIAGMAA